MLLFARKKIFNGVGSAVGLASEGMTAKKTNKASSSREQTQSPPLCSDSEYDDNDELDKAYAGYEHVWDLDEGIWDLDEAQEQLVPEYQPVPGPVPGPGSGPGSGPGYNENVYLAQSFAQLYPMPTSYERPYLPFPVVIPQRRPRTRARGFVRAYAPHLNAFGIDQDIFLDFIERANASCKGPQALGLLNLAALAAIPLGSPLIGMAISIALQIAVNTTIAMEGHRQSNKFFDEANREFFIPRGLFCLVMTWNPDVEDAYVTLDQTQAQAQAQTIQTTMDSADGEMGFAKKIKHKYGKAHADAQFLPETAPLEFPALDKVVLDPETQKKQDTLKAKTLRKMEFAAGYRDKRAQARFNADNDNALTQTPKPEFTSRYADPNHPASEGSPIALLTGGHVTEKQIFKYTPAGFAYNQGKKAYAKHKEREASAADGQENEKGSSKVKNILRKKVVYLMIVNMPSEEELQQARAAMQ